MNNSDVEAFHSAYTGTVPEETIERIDRFLAEHYQYTTWPTWAYDTTDPKERYRAAVELWGIMVKYTMFEYIEQYVTQYGRTPTLSELILWTEAQSVLPNVEADTLVS